MALPLHKEGSGTVSLLELFRLNAINTRVLVFTYPCSMLCVDTLTGCMHRTLSACVQGEHGCSSRWHIVVMLQLQNLLIHVPQEQL